VNLENSRILARAPARVNLIGEHTDYNGGFVLPMSTAIYTSVTATARSDRKVQVKSHTVGETCLFDLDDLYPGANAGWVEYVKGVAAELQEAGIALRGADLLVDSDIPLGAGLSSSASLELSVAKALLAVAGEDIASPELAELCQRAEHRYAAVHCGIMDQYTLACAKKGNAILLDCRSLEVLQVPLPGDAGFILTDSGERHSLSDGEYNKRADECAAAVTLLQQAASGIDLLRDLSADVLEANRNELGDVLYRRCRHVVTENERVQRSVQALANSDLQQVGSLIDECHSSLRDDFEVSCDEVEALVASANSSEHVFGSRMIGAGFGGCVLSLCRADRSQDAADEIRASYAAVSGVEPWQHIAKAAEPVRIASAA